MAGHHDPRLLYTVSGINAYHIQHGEETSLTPSGPQALSLIMVPTSNPFSDLSTTIPQNEILEEDFYLHLNLPPELDLPLPATTQIYHQPPRSYLIPRWDLGSESGAFTRIEFPPVGHGANNVTQEDIDTFETILAQCTSFMERAAAPAPGKGVQTYNPADYAPGGPHAGKGNHGQIVLVDEDNGSIVGQLSEGANVVEDSKLMHGTKNPVEIQISQDGSRIDVRPVSEDYLRLAKHPAYKDSSLVQNAATASRLIVTGSNAIGNILTSGADSFAQKTKPNPKPMEFSPSTHDRVRKINHLTQGAAGMSAKTVGQATKYAQNIGASLARRGERKQKGVDKDGRPVEGYRPGFMNKSMIAFSTIADGIAYSSKNLLTTGGAAATTVVGHRYGPEAGQVAAELAGGVKNVGLVYIDVTGVSRRAVIKSVAKGMVVGRVKGGGQLVVGGGDGGVIPDADLQKAGLGPSAVNDNLGGGQGGGPKDAGVIGFGNQAPPAYSSGVGEPLGAQGLQGQNLSERKGDETLLPHPSAAAAEGAGSKLSFCRADPGLLSAAAGAAAAAAAASQDVKTGIEEAKRGGEEEGMSEVRLEQQQRFSPTRGCADAHVPCSPPPSPASAAGQANNARRGSEGDGESQLDAHQPAKAAEDARAVGDKKRINGNDKDKREDDDDDEDEEGKRNPPGPPSGASRGARWFDAWFGGKAHWMDVGDFRAAPYT